ncbi:VirB3 family type IV secretion system protein [Candidatus Thiothrix sp. Deng01]|uniref:VirB3 family type IV secretion system protein n=1 Tax=Candidatus Thiothrix phosphatis TaxID=3112415 RepID=A0ABU6CU63_9GAMM|nr:VirB3 family type IV secretion system protein [Candidatus Thiothrix sp. Deng01]MEB4589684.1 VirB3 family type IV secretion system protein [Candidatus Thiothrix sp. Deng01]
MSQRQANHPEGYEAPVHLSLVEPVLVAGLPRTVGFIYWTIAAALTIGMHQLWILPVAMLGHWGLARLTRFDPHFMAVVRAGLRHTKDKLP